MDAAVSLDHSLLAFEGEHDVHVMLDLVAPTPAVESKRAPLSLALVVDRSGSMAGEKLEVAKRCAAWLVSRLRPDDRLALVSYDDEVDLLAPLAPVDVQALEAAIGWMEPGGSTNLSGGWLKGLEELRAAPADSARKILLLTDGHANMGVTDPAALVQLAAGAVGGGIGTTTIGFGSDFDEDLLTGMSDAGGGNAHYAETPDAAPGIFVSELEGVTSLVAQNVSVEIRPSEHVDVLGILNGYPDVETPGGVQIELGDAYGGDRRRIVFVLHVPSLVELGPATVAELVIRYVSVGDEIAEHTLTLPVTANFVSAAEAAAAQPDSQVQEEVLVLKAARARDEAILLADEGRHDAAEQLLHKTARGIRADAMSMPSGAAAALVEEAVRLEADASVVAPDMYLAASRKQLRYASNVAKRRRR